MSLQPASRRFTTEGNSNLKKPSQAPLVSRIFYATFWSVELPASGSEWRQREPSSWAARFALGVRHGEADAKLNAGREKPSRGIYGNLSRVFESGTAAKFERLDLFG